MPEEKKEIAVKTDSMLPSADWKKELNLVRDLVAKGCNETEFRLLLYLSKEHGLNPLKREVYAVKYGDNPAQIFISRDGALNIAHRSGQFESMETTCTFEVPDDKSKVRWVSEVPKPVSATCTIYKKGGIRPFRETVYFAEYNLKQALWLKKPVTMLKKVAEAQCLRKAFNIHGVYDSSEFPEQNGVIENAKKEEVGTGEV